jgi:tetratricopeptide (TPR) repeat protein
VDQTKFQEAQDAYNAGDFRSAAKGFLAAAGRGAAGNGAAYHMAGNALLRLRRHADAVTVYGHALRDETYDKHGAVYANLGTAYRALGELTESVTAFEAALADPEYATPYKAYQGIASAHMERGKVEEAAGAYRRAALDESNPDPGKALVNLGLCFMALGRPSDAVDAYKAALGFDDYAGRGKALANLGQAYTALGEYDQAVKAFEKATQLHTHKLSPAAVEAYETALRIAGPSHETVEGWVTGEIPVLPIDSAEPPGWGTGELEAISESIIDTGQPSGPVPLDDSGPDDDAAAKAADSLGFGDDAAVSEFFSLSEDEMKVRDREMRRAERANRSSSGLQRSALVGGLVAVVVAGIVLAAYLLGFGWPTQSATVNGLFVAYANGEAVEDYWVAVPDLDVKLEMAKVPPIKEFTVDSIDAGRSVSRAEVTVTPEKGAPMHYVVVLTREGVGWRVTGLDYSWRSTGG